MLSLQCKEWFKITGRGWVATMQTSQAERDQIKIKEPVIIDGHEYVVIDIEKHAIHSDIQNIGILIQGERKDI